MAARQSDLATVSFYAFPTGLPSPKAVPPPLTIVSDLNGPILALWGDRDEKVGMPNVDRFEAAMRVRDLQYEHVVYAGADHGFLADLDDTEAPSHAAAADSYERTLAFFAKHLGASTTGRVDL